jgi:transcription termination factor NusB
MKAKPNVSPEKLARLRATDEQLRPLLESEMPAVRDEWREYVKSLTSVVSRHSKEIDAYIQNHGPMTRPEVIERALTKLLSEV